MFLRLTGIKGCTLSVLANFQQCLAVVIRE